MNTKSCREAEKIRRRFIALVAATIGLQFTTLPVCAGTFTWDGEGADGNWSTTLNWVGNVAPVDGGTFHTFVFDGTFNTTTSADIAAGNGGLNTGDLIFNAGAGAFTIQGPESLDMLGVPSGAAANTEFADILNNSTSTQTITAELIHRPDFSLGMVFNADAGGILVPGVISQDGAGTDPVIIVGANAVLFSGANTYTTGTVAGLSLVADDFQSYASSSGPGGGDWDQDGTGTVRVEGGGPGGSNQYLGFGWEGGDPSAGTSRSATRIMEGIGTSDSAFVTFRARAESDTGEWYYGVSDTPPSSFDGGFATMNYAASVGLVEDATAADGKVDLVAGVEGGVGTTVLANLDTNQWYTIALLVDHADTSFDVYLDGVKLNGSPLAFQSTTAGAIDQFTVTGGGGSRFDGQLDDLTAGEAGTLQLDGNHTGAGSYLVDSGSRLTGTGSITLASGATLGGNALGEIAPGDRSGSTTGTFAVTGDVVLGAGTLAVRIDGTNDTSDRLAITGDLDVAGSTLDLSDVISAPDDASYTLVTYSGTLTGPVFANVLGLPVGYSLSYATLGEIRLQAGGDTDAPMVFSLSPADDATGVPATDNLTVTFDEVIQAASGNITLMTTIGTTVEAFDVETSTRLTFAGPSITIDPTANLVGGTGYHVLIDPTAVEDTAENAFAGISSATEWSFTAEAVAPTVVALSPADNTDGILANASLSMVFDETVFADTGNITIHLASDDSVVETLDVTSGNVTASGPSVIITPASDLPVSTSLYVNIPAGAFRDEASNPYSGISDNSTWSFTTGAVTPLVAENFGGSGAPLNGTTADAFDADIVSAGGSATWSAGADFLDDGTVTSTGNSTSASLNLGTFMDDAKGTADGKFKLTMTVSETSGQWISLGFAQSNTPSIGGPFTSQGGVATIIRREVGDWDLDMWGGPGTDNAVAGPEPTDPGNRTLTVTLDFTPVGGYNGTDDFGTVSWSDAVLGPIGSHTYDTSYSFGSIFISEAGSGGTISNLSLVQLTTAATTETAFDTWATTNGVVGGPSGDDDSGGKTNLYEFGLGGNATDGNDDGALLHVFSANVAGDSEPEGVLTILVRDGTNFASAGSPAVSDPVDGIVYSVAGGATVPVDGALTVTPVTPAVTTGLPGAPTGYVYTSFYLTGPEGYFQVTVEASP